MIPLEGEISAETVVALQVIVAKFIPLADSHKWTLLPLKVITNLLSGVKAEEWPLKLSDNISESFQQPYAL